MYKFKKADVKWLHNMIIEILNSARVTTHLNFVLGLYMGFTLSTKKSCQKVELRT